MGIISSTLMQVTKIFTEMVALTCTVKNMVAQTIKPNVTIRQQGGQNIEHNSSIIGKCLSLSELEFPKILPTMLFMLPVICLSI